MRKVVVTEFVSLDGVMEAPGGEAGYPHAGWVAPLFTDALGAFKEEEQLSADILLLGRKTYEGFVGAWPQRQGAMAEKINTMQKLVVSTTLGSSDWRATTVGQSDLEGTVRSLKQKDDGRILAAGSRSVVRALLAVGLVDEINLQVFPLILGSGARVFPEGPEPATLQLVSSVALESGVMLQTYRVVS